MGNELDDFIINPDNRILISEDIDCMGDMVKNRKEKEKEIDSVNKELEKDKKQKNQDDKNKSITNVLQGLLDDNKTKNNNNLSFLLNIFDGPIETPGRICIFTTNHKEKLDAALIRSGRVDCDIEFTKCTKKMLHDTLQHFFQTKIKYSLLDNYKEFSISPADVNNLCFKYNNVNETIDHIINKKN